MNSYWRMKGFFYMQQHGKYQRYISLILMIIISFGAQILGVIKTSAIAGIFGATQEMDAYNFANSMASFLFAFIATAVPTIIIPAYIKKKDDTRDVDCFLTCIYGVIILLVVLLIVFRFPIVALLTSREETYTNLVCTSLMILLVAQCLFSCTYVTTGFYQTKGQYNLPKGINFFVQALVICVLLIRKNLSITHYIYIIASSLILNAFLDIGIAIKMGWRYRPSFSLTPQVRDYLKTFLPLLFSTGIYQISLITDTIITEHLEVGMITVLAYTSQVSGSVNALVVGNLLIYMYPRIVSDVVSGKKQAVFWKQTQAMHCIIWLVIAGFITVGREGISILFEHGAFSKDAADAVYIGAAIYIFGQQFNVVRDLIYKYFYAKGDTKTPASNSVIVSICNIGISLLLMPLLGLYGVIIGTVCASFISFCVIFVRFIKRFGFDGSKAKAIGAYLKNVLIGISTVISVCFIKKYLPGEMDLLVILICGLATIVVYLILQIVCNKQILKTFQEL